MQKVAEQERIIATMQLGLAARGQFYDFSSTDRHAQLKVSPNGTARLPLVDSLLQVPTHTQATAFTDTLKTVASMSVAQFETL